MRCHAAALITFPVMTNARRHDCRRCFWTASSPFPPVSSLAHAKWAQVSSIYECRYFSQSVGRSVHTPNEKIINFCLQNLQRVLCAAFLAASFDPPVIDIHRRCTAWDVILWMELFDGRPCSWMPACIQFGGLCIPVEINLEYTCYRCTGKASSTTIYVIGGRLSVLYYNNYWIDDHASG